MAVWDGGTESCGVPGQKAVAVSSSDQLRDHSSALPPDPWGSEMIFTAALAQTPSTSDVYWVAASPGLCATRWRDGVKAEETRFCCYGPF